MKFRFDHNSINVRDLEKSLNFYKEALGITETRQIEPPDRSFKLIFLGDHLYTIQAKDSQDGIAFPYILVIIWIIALCLFLLFRFKISLLKPILYKKEIDEQRDEKIKKYALIVHIALLIIVFIMLDREISFQFGMSALDAFVGEGNSLILLVFIIIELIMWVIGFFILALPLRLIASSGLRIFGFGKGAKGIGKGIGAIGIWIFGTIYIKLIINLIFLMIDPSTIFPMG